jgi:hypothetical protein
MAAVVMAQQPGGQPQYYPPPPAQQAPPAYYPPPTSTQQPANAQRPQNYPPPSNYQTPQAPQQAPGYAPAPGYYQQPAGSYPAAAAASQQTAANPQTGSAGDQVPPYHVHRDLNHNHDHVYPDRGSVVRDLPHGAMVVNYAGMSYHFSDGVWFEPRGPAYLVIEPPIGLVVPTLPQFMTPLNTGTETILYANDTYYRARPDIGGYEVVNDPIDAQVAPDASGGAAVATALAAPVATAAAAPPPTTAPVAAAGTPAAAKPPEQQARDQYECYRFAVTQSGFDPMRVGSSQTATQQSDYERAHSACLQARGYAGH